MQSAVVAGDGLGDRDVLDNGIGLGVGESAGEGDGLGVEGEKGALWPNRDDDPNVRASARKDSAYRSFTRWA